MRRCIVCRRPADIDAAVPTSSPKGYVNTCGGDACFEYVDRMEPWGPCKSCGTFGFCDSVCRRCVQDILVAVGIENRSNGVVCE